MQPKCSRCGEPLQESDAECQVCKALRTVLGEESSVPAPSRTSNAQNTIPEANDRATDSASNGQKEPHHQQSVETKEKQRLNPTVTVAAMAAAGGFVATGSTLLQLLLPHSELIVVLTIAVLCIGSAFGGYLAAAMALHSPVEHATRASLYFALLTSSNVLLYLAKEYQQGQHALWQIQDELTRIDFASIGPNVRLDPETIKYQQELETARRQLREQMSGVKIIEALGFLALAMAASAGFYWMGAVAYDWSIRRSAAANSRREWSFLLSSGRIVRAWSPARYSAMGYLWRSLQALLLASLPFNALFFRPAEGQKKLVWAVLLGQNLIGMLILALACRALARRCLALGVQELLQSDPRPPILYLRSFKDDGMRPSDEAGFWRSFAVGVTELLKPEFELGLTRIANKIGPVVAIGRPGELLPFNGAARMYVSDEDWKDVISDLLARSQLVILQASNTEGFRWELEKVVAAGAPEKTLLFIPIPLDRNKKSGYQYQENESREDKYWRRFAGWAKEVFPFGLPERIGDSFFVAFVPAPRWKPLAIQDPHNIQSDLPTAPLLTSLLAERMFRRPKEIGLALGLLIILAAVAAMCALVWKFAF